MKYEQNINDVAALEPDYLGFIFYDKSPRFFNKTIPQLPTHVKKVGVFVDALISTIMQTIETHNLEVIQLHGSESVAYCEKLRDKLSREGNDVSTSQKGVFSKKNHKIQIIKAFSLDNNFNFDVLRPYENVCDFYLFDTKGRLPGGNGYAFDWSILKNYSQSKPYFLSGGIGIENIKAIDKFVKSSASKYCYAIDVNSKFEIEPGLKNTKSLKEFKSLLSTR